MSEPRKILVANRVSRKTAAFVKRSTHVEPSAKKALKRPLPRPSTTPANDRLKRLRTRLNEEAEEALKAASKQPVKRGPLCAHDDVTIPPKLAKQPERVSVPYSTKIPKKFTFRETETSPLLRKDQATTCTKESIDLPNAWKDDQMDWAPCSASISTPSTSHGKLYIVTDTNIFISRLDLIQEIIDRRDGIDRVVFIPWMVIEELDYLKSDSTGSDVKYKAQSAVKYIEAIFKTNNPRLRGQNLQEVNEQKNVSANQDNKVIACCLQVQEKHNMICLTDDVNLRNKAHMNKIPTCGHSEIMYKIMAQPEFEGKNELIANKLVPLCTAVIKECAEKSFGQVCYQMPICQSVPKNLKDCLLIFQKYWPTVFQEYLLKQFRKATEDFLTFIDTHSDMDDNTSHMKEFIRYGIRLCVYMKDVDSCSAVIESTINELNKIGSM